MTNIEKIAEQRQERQKCLDAILESPAPHKIIVAGPGTGKTFTFGQLLKLNADGANLAMTFIRKLVNEMEDELGEYSEVKTFHGYCKKILHEQNGHVELVPYLTKIVEKDATLLGEDLENFNSKFQRLEEASPEVEFHLRRGDYYKVVAFDDSIYRLYKLLQNDPNAIPAFGQIVVDEFQDFNALEVALLSEFEKKGPILIVGDDDQAVYDQRCASPNHLRYKYKSEKFTVFELPFCSRCPEVIVAATNALISKVQSMGHLEGRIDKRYECYLEAKEQDSVKYPRIVTVQCTTGKVIPMYIREEISKVTPEEIVESHEQKYPTVLIVGPKHYLRETKKRLQESYPQLLYSPSKDVEYGVIEGYQQILKNAQSNLGWRILMECFLGVDEQRRVLALTQDYTEMIKLLDLGFVESHLRSAALIRSIQNAEKLEADLEKELRDIVGDRYDEIVRHFSPVEDEEEPEIDTTQPSILLTSYVGCKGLSAGHVFLVGVNNGTMPRDPNNIKDVEISQFVVALTRTRKQCHIISDKWFIAPVLGGKRIPHSEKTTFISYIPPILIKDRGSVKAADFK